MRLVLVQVFETFKQKCVAEGRKAVDCDLEFIRLYDSHQIELPEGLREAFPKCPSRATLQKLVKDNREGGSAALIYAPGKRGKASKIKGDPVLEQEVQAAIANLGPKASSVDLYKLLQRMGSDKAKTLSRENLQYYCVHLQTNQKALWVNLTDPKGYKNSATPKFGTRSLDYSPNDLWELDFTRNDIVLKLGNERKRFCIGGCIDVATRRVRFILSTAPRGEATAELLLRCVRDWGLPRTVRPDNGKEFLNRQVKNLAHHLKFDLDPCIPGKPEEKPHIERIFGTLNHDLIPLLPSYVGNSVAQRQGIREAKGEETLMELAMDFEQFENWVDLWRRNYEQAHHSTLGMSPIEKLGEFQKNGWQPVYTTSTDENLRMLALPHKLCTVQTYGIKYQNRQYIAAELGGLIGQKVMVLYDSTQPHRLWVLDSDQKQCLCEAKWDTTLTPEEAAALAVQAKAAAKPIAEAGTKARRGARNTAKRLQANPEMLLNPNTVAQMQQIGEQVSNDLVESIRAAEPLPANVISLASRRKAETPLWEIPVEPDELFIPAADLLPDTRTEREKAIERIHTLLFHTPAVQWTADDVEFLNDEDQYRTVAALIEDHADFLASGVAAAMAKSA